MRKFLPPFANLAVAAHPQAPTNGGGERGRRDRYDTLPLPQPSLAIHEAQGETFPGSGRSSHRERRSCRVTSAHDVEPGAGESSQEIAITMEQQTRACVTPRAERLVGHAAGNAGTG